MHLTRTLSLSAAALVAAVSLTACSDDADEPKKSESSSQSSPAADTAAEQDPQAVADAANEWYTALINETLAAIEAEVTEDDMADFAAFIDEWYPETSAGVAWDTFASEVHAYAMLRSIVGLAMLSIGLVDDPAAEAASLLEEERVEASWIVFDGDVASVNEPDVAPEDTIPINLIERDGVWLIDGAVFDDAWFEEQGTTAEEALNN